MVETRDFYPLTMGTPASHRFQRFSKHSSGRWLKVLLFLCFPNFYRIVTFKFVLKYCDEGCFYDES